MIAQKDSLLDGMPGVEVDYLRLGGTGTKGRWYFEVRWQNRLFHLEFQPNTLRYSRAGALKEGLDKPVLGKQLREGIRPQTLQSVVEDISEQVKAIGIYSKLRRSKDQLAEDLAGFMAAVILQHCHPDQTIIDAVVARTRSYLEKGFVKPSAKVNVQWSFGSNIEGWWFMREVPT